MTNLCQHNGMSCYGCCGHGYKGKEAVLADIKENTVDLSRAKNLIEFKRRYPSWVLGDSGICRNLVQKGKKTFCPLHPAKNKGEDLRKGHCDVNHLCRTFRHFLTWDEEKKNKFIGFILAKNLDNHDYSMGMDSGKLLREFNK